MPVPLGSHEFTYTMWRVPFRSNVEQRLRELFRTTPHIYNFKKWTWVASSTFFLIELICSLGLHCILYSYRINIISQKVNYQKSHPSPPLGGLGFPTKFCILSWRKKIHSDIVHRIGDYKNIIFTYVCTVDSNVDFHVKSNLRYNCRNNRKSKMN